VAEDFSWRDGERLVRFAQGAADEAGPLLDQHGFRDFTLLATDRTQGSAPSLTEAASGVVHVPPGRVDEISSGLLGDISAGAPLVAFGGGRVIDTAKAIGGAIGSRVAAIPTTLSGAEMTPFHRLPTGVEGGRLVRPALVIADPELMASAPLGRLAATAMNALAHAMEALYTPAANPVNDAVALRAATLISTGLGEDGERLSLGALLAGQASGNVGIAFHHAVSQTIVRVAGTPHAETNAVMLPHSARFAATRAPEDLAALAEALGSDDAAARIAELSALCGATRLSELGVEKEQLSEVVAALGDHRGLALTPGGPPLGEELLALLEAAL